MNEQGPNSSISTIAALGTNGYVVNSVPFAIYCSTKILDLGLEEMLRQIINADGDTDTNASIAGQIAGTLIGTENIPTQLILKLQNIPDYKWISQVIERTKLKII
nr:ADP-ribosylglycohydrolase family protein [uncultured Chryseobacterium sp.]